MTWKAWSGRLAGSKQKQNPPMLTMPSRTPPSVS